MKTGKIVSFNGSWGSGIASLSIEDSVTGLIEQVHCENGPTVRALASVFPGTIVEGHRVDVNRLKGEEIHWDYDEFGLVLGWFSPVYGD